MFTTRNGDIISSMTKCGLSIIVEIQVSQKSQSPWEFPYRSKQGTVIAIDKYKSGYGEYYVLVEFDDKSLLQCFVEIPPCHRDISAFIIKGDIQKLYQETFNEY